VKLHRWLVACLLLPWLGGCYFLLEPPEPLEPEIEEKDRPVPVPVPTPYPEPTAPERAAAFADAGLSILWLFRMDERSPNVVGIYTSLFHRFHSALQLRGIPVEGEAVGSLYDQRLFWGRNRDVPAPVSVDRALRFHAMEPAPEPGTCTVASLVSHGYVFAQREVEYPDALFAEGGDGSAGSEGPGSGPPVEVTRRVRPFSAVPAALVVVLVDVGPRPAEVDEWPCRFGKPSASHYFGGSSPVTWLRLEGNRHLVREQIRFALIATPEQVSRETMTQLCLSSPDFPRPALDVIEPSPVRFFDRFDEDLRPMTARFDFCEAGGGQWNVDRFLEEMLLQLQTLEPAQP
jgi:hypothetical protein